MDVSPVTSEADREGLRPLLGAFHAWMHDHVGDVFDPDDELTSDLESLSANPRAWAWLARHDGTPAGCVLLYGQSETVAEFRRLWVQPAARGNGLGRALVRTVVEAARARGYETLGLTTPPWAEASHRLYESMGFERTPPYPETRLDKAHHDEAIFMRLDLS